MPGHLDILDRRLLDDFQRNLPLVPQPFAALGAELGISENETLARLAALRARGMISRVGATLRPNTAGASTLCAMAVPGQRIEEVAASVSAERGVNHVYLREDGWNLWFVATAPDRPGLAQALARLERDTGLAILDLRLIRAFTIDLGFSLTGEDRRNPPSPDADTAILRAGDRPLLQALSDGLALVPRPFAALAATCGGTEASVIARIGALGLAHIIARLGVIVRHRALGFTANAMAVWDVPDRHMAAAGAAVARMPHVSLCYQRQPVPGQWHFGLFAMVHARSRCEALAVVAGLAALPELGGAPSKVLFSNRCFKQTGPLVHAREKAA
jgi:DNA-binding Lrp family transcriptional regulator